MKVNTPYLAPVVKPFQFKEQKGKWKYVLTSPLKITFPKDYWGPHWFADKDGKIWSTTDQRDWTIREGYAWDGATLAPDFKETIAASCWHDAASQFRHLLCISTALSGGVWNARFAEIIRAQGAPWLASIYHAGLTIGNPVYHAIGSFFGKKPTGQCLFR